MNNTELLDDPSANHITTIDAAITHCATHCNHPVLSPGFTPSRLLFLGSPNDTTNNNIHLITYNNNPHPPITTPTPHPIKYAALSYCWGPPLDAQTQPKTTVSSLPSRLSHIPPSSLSPILRDAISVTRRLGLSHLWIDSLCIIQDDHTDWESQSAVMGQIYSNAYVIIVGLNSPSCRVGFLAGREWPYFGGSGSNEVMAGREGDGDAWRFAAAMSKAKWSTRGWTFQEKALSTRLVYFDGLNVHVRCANYTFREGRRGPLLGKQLAFLEAELEQGVTVDVASVQADGSAEAILESWRNILVPRFATCQFSVPTDRLPAIAGLARHVGEVTGYEYAAGLWVPCLYWDLAWSGRGSGRGGMGFDALFCSLNPEREIVGGGAGYIAPSWSWARNEMMERLQFVDLPQRSTTENLEVVAQVEVSVKVKGLNPYGQVSGGELAVVSTILPLPPDEYHKIASRADSGFELDWDLEEGSRLPSGLEMVMIGSYIAKVRFWPDTRDVDQRRVYGIVIYPAHITGKYYRVGMFNAPLGKYWWMDFENVPQRNVIIL